MAYIQKAKTDDWKTPKKLYEGFKNNGYFDPCPLKSDFDGLKIDWKEKNFVNPPYSKLRAWIEKAIEESKKGKEVFLLIPSRTDTKAFLSLSINMVVIFALLLGGYILTMKRPRHFQACL